MDASSAGLFDAYDLIKNGIGKGKIFRNPFDARHISSKLVAAAFLFALALLLSGQTASITATLAGQVVSEGFIEWRISVSIGTTTISHFAPLTLLVALLQTPHH